MKNANVIGTLLLSMTLAASMTGCKHPNPIVTPINDPNAAPKPPGSGPGTGNVPTGPGNESPISQTPPPITSNPIPLAFDTNLFANGAMDHDKFKADTVYFDFDSSTIKASEESKLQEVATYLKSNPTSGVIIEGNCDERGTEKYNLSLGERRSLASREYLINSGVDPLHLKTATYGASKPVDPGHNEAAWKQNRRDEFVLVTPK